MRREVYVPLSPLLRLKVPVTVAEPLPVAVQVTLHVPVAASAVTFNGLYAPKLMPVALTVQLNTTAAGAFDAHPNARQNTIGADRRKTCFFIGHQTLSHILRNKSTSNWYGSRGLPHRIVTGVAETD
jgi:hypothetical protein